MKNSTTDQLENMIMKFTDPDLFFDTFFLENLKSEDMDHEWKIKFMITEVISDGTTKFIRKVISPLLQKSSHYEFGWFHTSILVKIFF